MNDSSHQMPNLDELISASAREEFPGDEPGIKTPSPVFNHPWAVLISCSVCILVAALFYLDSVEESDLGIRSTEVRLGVAMYHVAHRVESYRHVSGELPEFLEESWGGKNAISYEKNGSGYTLHGEAGALKIRFEDGDDPELLLHNLTRFEVPSP